MNSRYFDDPDREAALKRYLRALATVPIPHSRQEQALARRAVTGDDDARLLLVAMNSRLVVSVAKRYVGHGLPLLDLIAVGNRGLEEAVMRYDPHSGTRFSLQARHWVRAALHDAIGDGEGAEQ